jgi:hypothetical protein
VAGGDADEEQSVRKSPLTAIYVFVAGTDVID